jgi:O-antigen/teichoic acid export membrane protein
MIARTLHRFPDLIRTSLARLVYSRIVHDSAALLIADWSTVALGLIASVILARALGSQGYGTLILGAAVVTTLTQFMSIRTGEGLVRFVGGAVARGDRREAISFFYVGVSADALVSVVTLAVALTVIPWWVRAYPASQLLRELALIYTWSIPFATLEGSFSAVCHVFKQFKLYAGLTILIGLFRVAILVVLAPLGLRPVMWGYVAIAAFSFLTWMGAGMWLLGRRVGTWHGSAYRSAARRFASFTFHTGLTASLTAVSKNIDVLVLGAFRPVAEVGFYRIAYSAAGLVAMPVAPVNTVLYPEMTEAWTMENAARVKRLIRQYVLHAAAVTAAIYVFLLVSIGRLVEIFYGVKFHPVANLVRILGVAVLLGGLFHWARQATLAKGKPHLATVYNSAALALRLALLVPFILAFGVAGAAWAYVIVMLFTVVLIRLYVMPRLGL